MIYDLIPENDKRLITPTDSFDFTNPPIDPQELFNNLKETMIHHKGIGLAANQVGLPYSVFIIGSPDDPDTIIGCFNPKIVDVWGDEIYMTEGCLSFPRLILKIKRFSSIRARYTVPTGVTNTIKFEGMTARIFQHEYDHLNGITFKKRCSRYHLEKADKLRKNFNRRLKNFKR